MMAKKIRHIDKKDLIRAELMKCIRSRPIKKAYYGDIGLLTETGPRGPSKAVLDFIAEKAKGLPDITVILVRKDTGYPGQIDGKKIEKPTSNERLRIQQKCQQVIDKYNPGAVNPFS
jgi:hypothetical protein